MVESIGKRVFRLWKGLSPPISKKQFALDAGMAPGTLSDLMHDRIKQPGAGKLVGLAKALHVSVYHLENGKGERTSGVDDSTLLEAPQNWPFETIDRSRFDRLSGRDKTEIEAIVDFLLSRCEVARIARATKSRTG